MRFIGVTNSGRRLYRAPSLGRAKQFALAFDGTVEFGVLLHKWYVAV